MNEWIFPIKKLVFSKDTGKWCRLPYPNHKKGCPNYNKADRCPPKAPKMCEVFDMESPLYLVHSEFDLKDHAEHMKAIHPEWSERQCRCVLYWQPKSRKQLKERIELAHYQLGTNWSETCPEAMGMNVYATARLAGLHLERIRSLSTCRHIALVGWKNVGSN